MNMKTLISMVILWFTTHPVKAAEDTSVEALLAVINEVAEEVVVEGNTVQFSFKGISMFLIHDQQADRMRLVAPIIETKDLEAGMLEKAMEANFHTALDARYATSEGIVWSVFIHPLSDLQPSFFKSAILQVATARVTFGDGYTSGAMSFGVAEEEDVI